MSEKVLLLCLWVRMNWACADIETILLAEGRPDGAVDGDADPSLDDYIAHITVLILSLLHEFQQMYRILIMSKIKGS